ncbi:MAG TPA: homoserine dehydrogenase [Chitinophagaceae bacterium]|nr:homoserine dehydrogenase [Chitinophagaceae bacterium]
MSLQHKQLTIGLFGFGVVGEGLYKVLQQTPSLQASIKKICIKHPEKKRDAPADLFTTDASVLLNDPEINVIVELIDDADAAFDIACAAFSRKKALISASKKMIAAHLPELLQLQEQYQVSFLYEAACCASIPVIRNLEEYYDNDLLQGIQGIVNGSTNYILSRIAQDNLSFNDALRLAQEKGFAESNPALDIEGTDAVNKLTILLSHAYGVLAQPASILHTGIQNLKPADARFASEKGYRIKLVAQARKLEDGTIAAFVLPQFVPADHALYQVNDEYNGVIIESGLADRQFFSGKGAGSFPTASAVLSDISALRYNYRYEYKKLNSTEQTQLSNDFYLKVYVSFNRLLQVPHHLFASVEEWSSNKTGCSVSGIIHYSRLQENWWRNDYTSLILYPDAIIEADQLPEQKVIEENWQELVTG